MSETIHASITIKMNIMYIGLHIEEKLTQFSHLKLAFMISRLKIKYKDKYFILY